MRVFYGNVIRRIYIGAPEIVPLNGAHERDRTALQLVDSQWHSQSATCAKGFVISDALWSYPEMTARPVDSGELVGAENFEIST